MMELMADGDGTNRKESDAARPQRRFSSELAIPLLLILKQCVIGAADIVAIVELGAAHRERTFTTLSLVHPRHCPFSPSREAAATRSGSSKLEIKRQQ